MEKSARRLGELIPTRVPQDGSSNCTGYEVVSDGNGGKKHFRKSMCRV
jgi:hypothetical protein